MVYYILLVIFCFCLTILKKMLIGLIIFGMRAFVKIFPMVKKFVYNEMVLGLGTVIARLQAVAIHG